MMELISSHSSPVHLSNVRLDESWKTEVAFELIFYAQKIQSFVLTKTL